MIKRIKRKGVTFILTPEKIYFETAYQICYLEPVEYYWLHRMKFIGTLIELGEVRDLSGLAYYCGSAIKWTPTQKERLAHEAR